ncbi:hypothetical protein BGZ47_001469 [Haplosporangium gracile]|nr:hypothetical protein BGZ47_001469 [Haplosporangium gracile]
MPTTRTFSFVFRGKQVEVEREYASDEEELINTKPRCLWPDDGRDYSPQEQEQQDDYYEENHQLDQYEHPSKYDDESRVEPDVQYHHHHEHSNRAEYEQQEGPGTPPPISSISSSPDSQAAEHSGHDHDRQHQHDAYEEEEDDPLPPQPIINRGYVAESVTMIQHQSQPTGTQQEGDYTDEEDSDHNVEQDDTIYTALYDSSDYEDVSPMYSQESSLNPFEHIPNPEEDWLIAQERERQRIASRHKLGIVGRGIKYPIPADLLEAPSPTTTFGRTTLWPIRVEVPESSTSRQRAQNLTIPAQPNFSTGPAFNLASLSASTSASASAAASLPLVTTSAPSAQVQSQSARVTVPEDKKKGRVSTSTSTVVTRPAQPNEIQAIYAAILGRRNVPEKEQEERSRFQNEGIGARHNDAIATGGSGSSLYGSEEEQEPEEKMDVLKEYDGKEVTLTAEELFQEKVAELGPCNPASKRHFTAVDECEVEDEADEDDTLHASEQGDVTGLHKCEVFDGLCWNESKRELEVGVYWFHKGERSLRCVHRRFDKFQLLGGPDFDESPRNLLQLSTSQNSTSEPTTPQLSLDTSSLSSGYFS